MPYTLYHYTDGTGVKGIIGATNLSNEKLAARLNNIGAKFKVSKPKGHELGVYLTSIDPASYRAADNVKKGKLRTNMGITGAKVKMDYVFSLTFECKQKNVAQKRSHFGALDANQKKIYLKQTDSQKGKNFKVCMSIDGQKAGTFIVINSSSVKVSVTFEAV